MLPKYKRILLKLSGESLMGDKNFGLDSEVFRWLLLLGGVIFTGV
jgi:uridylate kinase